MPDPTRPTSQVDERAVDAAFQSVNEHFALFGSLHGQAVPIADTLLRDILRGAILTYLDATSDQQPMCHNGHPFEPGQDADALDEPGDPRWCDTCGEARRPAHSDPEIHEPPTMVPGTVWQRTVTLVIDPDGTRHESTTGWRQPGHSDPSPCAHPTGPCPGPFCSCGCRKCRPDLYGQPDENDSLPVAGDSAEADSS